MLDEQVSTKGNNHTRLKWQEGSVVEKAAPMNCKLWMIKKVVVTDERSSGSKAIIAPTARTPGGDLVSDADLDSDCSE